MKVAGKSYRSIWAEADRSAVHVIDQSRLPHVFETLRLDTVEAVAEAIKAMRLRGAPLIGVAAAYGIALAVSRTATDASISRASNALRATRPTAVNLAWAIGRMRERLKEVKARSEEHTSELQSRLHLVCRLLLEKKKKKKL